MKTKIILLALCWFAFSYNAKSQNLLESIKAAEKLLIYGAIDSKSNNTLSRLTGTWTKSQILYPNGRIDWISNNQQVTVSIAPDFNDATLMGYRFFMPGSSEAFEEGKVWFAAGGNICFRKEYTPGDPGLQFKFGTDDRGMESLMIKALLLSNEEVWLI